MSVVLSRFKHHVSFDENTRYTWCIIYENLYTHETELIHILNNATEKEIKRRKNCKITTLFRSEETDHLFNRFEELLECKFNVSSEYLFTYNPKNGNYILNVI